jgi:hypothetical protein
VCGRSLEEAGHDHVADDVDPRLAALRDFRPAGDADVDPGADER